MDHLDSFLPEYLLGELGPVDQAAWELHLGRCSSCRRMVSRAPEGLAAASTAAAPERVFEGVLASVALGHLRFAPLLNQLASFLDWSGSEAEALLRRLDEPSAWRPGPVEGSSWLPLSPGPRWSGAACSVVRLQAGARYPDHLHEGPEHVFVLQGGYRSSDGEEVWRGDQSTSEAGTRHSLLGLAGPDCLCAVVAEAR